ncbi:MAG: hypothetical protein ACYTFQ_30740, partial [Planctomycetota bacterium]
VAVGDLERTQNSFANTARLAKGELKTLGESMGKMLIAAMDTQGGIGGISEGLSNLNIWLKKNQGSFIKWGSFVISTVKWMTDIVVMSIRFMKNGIELVIDGIMVAWFGLMVGMKTKWNEFATDINDLIGKLPEMIRPAFRLPVADVEASQRMLSAALESGKEDLLDVVDAVGTVGEGWREMAKIAGDSADEYTVAVGTVTTANEELAGEGATAPVALTGAAKILAELQLGLDNAATSSALLGEQFNLAGAEASAYATAMNALITLWNQGKISGMEMALQIAAIAQAHKEAEEASQKHGQVDEEAKKKGIRMAHLYGNTMARIAKQVGAGQKNMAQAIKAATFGVIGDIAGMKSKEQIAEGTAKLAAGTWPPNPAALAAAGKHFAAAALFAALGGAAGAAGGGGGGGGGAGAGFGGGFDRGRGFEDMDRGSTTLVIEGGFLDLNDPRQEESFRGAWEEATGRRVIVEKP